jgi:hypothetical protein
MGFLEGFIYVEPERRSVEVQIDVRKDKKEITYEKLERSFPPTTII